MRLSTAIALGRMTVKEWKATKLHGCALGMAGNAAGLTSKWVTGAPFSYIELEATWPWLTMEAGNCPVGGCTRANAILDSNLMLIAHIFDSHIVDPVSYTDAWTLDQLIDFVRTIEPKEEKEQNEARNEQHEEVAVRQDPGVL